jgi:septal ring-binding cell division protein DamX
MRLRTSWNGRVVCLFLIAIGLATLGCTAGEKTQPSGKKSTEPYRVEKEGAIPPLSQEDVRKEVDREETYEDLPVSEEPVSSETVEPAIPPPAPSPEVAPPSTTGETPGKTMDGYRIQVFASGSEAAAQGVRESAEVRVGMPAYVEYVDGVYKVRVGDCPSRAEAESLVKRCREAGYGDAWIVSTRIVMPQRQTAP